ncbi:protein liaG [Bacillus licheniformis]|uniref:LiaG family protein n=1 Tax=Bacillus cabrialesii TaxID=2487276 RepID=UPI000950DF10|nr:protein liaG [Bacillus licheniformis]
MNKMLGKLLITAGILIFFAVIVKDVFAAGLGFVNGTETDSASALPRNIDSVVIESDNKDVRIIAEERNDISAGISGDSGKLFVNENRKKLELTAKEKEFQFLNGFNRSSLVVRIPYDYKGDLTVRTSSGDVSVDGNHHLVLSGLNAVSASGNMRVTNVRLQELKVKGSSGDVTISNTNYKTAGIDLASGDANLADVSGSLDVKMTSGNLDAALKKVTGPVSVTLTSGDADLSLPQNGSFTVSAKSSSGDVSSPYSFADTAHKEEHQITGSQGSGGHPIDIKTDSGDVTIR